MGYVGVPDAVSHFSQQNIVETSNHFNLDGMRDKERKCEIGWKGETTTMLFTDIVSTLEIKQAM